MMQNLPTLKLGYARTEQGYFRPIPEIEIPLGIVEGAAPGPLLVVTAGVHASEYVSIETAARLMHIDPQRLRGTLLVLPILNVTGFRDRSIYIMPEDGKNLNRAFPGNAEGSASERLANWLTTEVLAKADAYLDLHGGDMSEGLQPFTIYPYGHSPSEELAAAFGLPIAAASQSQVSTIGAAASLDVPSVLVEIGCNGIWSEDEVVAMIQGVERAMGHLGMIQGVSPAAAPRRVTFSVPVAPASGLWYSTKRVADPVSAGEKLGEIRDVFGKVLATISAEMSGEILYRLTTLAVNTGEVVVAIGVPVPPQGR